MYTHFCSVLKEGLSSSEALCELSTGGQTEEADYRGVQGRSTCPAVHCLATETEGTATHLAGQAVCV